jgi:hypothetical protein
VTDLASSSTAPIAGLPEDADIKALMDQLVAEGNVIFVSHPGALLSAANEDPLVRKMLSAQPIREAWLWRNGPEQVLLVYALEFTATESG